MGVQLLSLMRIAGWGSRIAVLGRFGLVVLLAAVLLGACDSPTPVPRGPPASTPAPQTPYCPIFSGSLPSRRASTHSSTFHTALTTASG